MQSTSNNVVFNKVVRAVEQTIYAVGHGLSSATRLVDDLELGKFGRLKLALYLEETFDIELTDEAVEHFDTVGDIVKYMNSQFPESVGVVAPAIARH